MKQTIVKFEYEWPGMTRRGFLRTTSALVASQAVRAEGSPAKKSLGIAYTSFPVRMRQARASKTSGPALPAREFLELCRSFGADGAQMDIAQLPSREPGELKGLRQWLEERGMFLELSVGAKLLEDPEAFAGAAGVAHALGVSRLRTAIDGRRYEEFSSRASWDEFAARWRKSLERAAPMLERHRLRVGVENHKDWLSGELVDILRRIDSPSLGACVDFGNNLALLEDSLALAEALAPYAVTTHLKDMAVGGYDRGFLLSEVPLGEGLLPLPTIMERLRRSNPDIAFCLEMITRDPLKVPVRDDAYWATRDRWDDDRLARFQAQTLGLPPGRPLPRISSLDDAGMRAAEDENIRRCVEHYRKVLEG
jgi:sugar phosphate isomerase/epimerase